MKKLFLLFLCLISFTISSKAQSELNVFEEWTDTIGTQLFYYKSMIEIDAYHNIYIAGSTLNDSNNYDMLVAKYNSSGILQWKWQYDGPGNGDDIAIGLCLDPNNDLYITGNATNDSSIDAATIHLNRYGTFMWAALYDGPGNGFDSGADVYFANGDVYTSGCSYNANGNSDILTIKYNNNGVQQWANLYDYNAQLNDAGVKITYYSGYLHISSLVQTDTTSYRCGVITYNTSGTLVGTKFSTSTSTGIDQVNDMVTDLWGYIYIAGAVPVAGQGYNYDIIKLNSNLGVEWERTYNSASSLDDVATGIKVDDLGNVYVTGYTTTSTEGKNITTIKYNSSGTQQWAEHYNNDDADGDDAATTMEMNTDGNIFVGGYTMSESNLLDFITIKYDTTGNHIWTITSDGNAHLNDKATNIALDDNEDVIITGVSETSPGTYEYLTVKYVEKYIVNPPIPSGDDSLYSFSYYRNKGQLINTSDTLVPEIRYYTQNYSPAFYFKDNSYSFVFAKIDTSAATTDTLHRIDVDFQRINSNARTYPIESQKDYLNYFLGHCPQGITKLYSNKKLVTTDIYKDIDLMYSSNQSGIKHYYIIKPGGDPNDIEMLYTGATSLSYDSTNKTLSINASIGSITYQSPVAYQLDSLNNIIPLTSWQPEWNISYPGNIVSFITDTFDNTKVLVIEVVEGSVSITSPPNTPEWGTFFGGSNDDMAYDITSDQYGNIYVTGYTTSADFPKNNNAIVFQSGIGGNRDAFIAGFNNNYHLNWTTYYGGNDRDCATGITYNEYNNRIYICGSTYGSYPSVFSYQPNLNFYNDPVGGSDKGFIARFTNNGTNREWGTYFGNNYGSRCEKIKADANGNIYVIGSTPGDPILNTCSAPAGGGFPICDPGNGAYIQNFYAGGFWCGDGFIAKFNKDSELVWSTLYGGANDDYFENLAIDNNNNKLYIVGNTNSLRQGTNYCTPSLGFPLCNNGGYFQNNLNGNNTYDGYPDGFILRFTFNGNLEWSTFFGGVLEDAVTGIGINNDGDVYITGFTMTYYYSTCNCVSPQLGDDGFPKCSTGAQYVQTYEGEFDAFIARFDEQTNLLWTTFIGGEGPESAEDVASSPKITIDNDDNVFVFGNTRSGTSSYGNFPIFNNSSYYMQTTNADAQCPYDNTDNFVISFDASDQLLWSTYFGGEGYLLGTSPAFGDFCGNITSYANKVYICGGTYSTNDFPLFCGDPQTMYNQTYTTVTSSRSDAYIAQLASPTASINENSLSNNNEMFTVSPNPNNGMFSIIYKCNKEEVLSITIYNIMGSVLKKMSVKTNPGSSAIPIDISDIPCGIYLLNIINKNVLQNCKFIKQ